MEKSAVLARRWRSCSGSPATGWTPHCRDERAQRPHLLAGRGGREQRKQAVEGRERRVERRRRQRAQRGEPGVGGAGRLARPLLGEGEEPCRVAGVAGPCQGLVQGPRRFRAHGGAARPQREVRAPEERHGGGAAGQRGDEVQCEIHGSRDRFRRERQRIVALERHARRREDAAREVQVRQRTGEDHRRPIQARVERRRAPPRLDAPYGLGNLLFPVAIREVARLGVVRHEQRPGLEGRRLPVVEADLLDAGQQRVDALVPARRELRFGRDDVDRVDAVESREQVEVRRPEAARLHRPIRNGDDQPSMGRGARVLEPEATKAVFVHGAAREHPAFVGPERRDEEHRLPEHPLGAAVERRAILELLHEQALEVVDALLLPAELVVELEHLAHERRTQLEGGTEPLGDGLVRGGEEDDFAVVGRQPLDRNRQAQAERVVELGAGDEIRAGRAPGGRPRGARPRSCA